MVIRKLLASTVLIGLLADGSFSVARQDLPTVGEVSSFESGILVIGDTLYVTSPHTTLALDAVTCKVRWRHVYQSTDPEIHPTNRGPAYANGRIFRGTGDGRLLALNARTGAEIWRVAAGDSRRGEFFSASPIFWKNRLYIGTSGGDWTASGRMMAYDCATGREIWRFNLVPKDGEPGAETWSNPAGSPRMGGATWSTYSLDPVHVDLFVATGNPAPALAPDERRGADLYTDAVVVLDADTGKLRWYYQALPNDGLDYDVAAAPVLYRLATGRRAFAVAGKDGFLSLVDRQTHARLAHVPVTTIENPGVHATVDGVRVCPSLFGAVLWNGPAFDPRTRTLFVGAIDDCGMVYSHGGNPQSEGARGFGTAGGFLPGGEAASGWVTAVNADTGRISWKYHADAPIVSALTPTAAGIIFGGTTDGNLFALDSATGEELYRTPVGGMLGGGVVTYALSGQQYVAFIYGGMMRGSFMRHVGKPTIAIATIGAATTPVVKIAMPESDMGPPQVYAQLCALCHGSTGEGLDAPDLRGVAAHLNSGAIAQIIEHPGIGMPAYYPDVLGEKQVEELAQFIAAWK